MRIYFFANTWGLFSRPRSFLSFANFNLFTTPPPLPFISSPSQSVLFVCAILTQVLDFYVEKIAVQHIEASMVSFLGLLASFAGAMVLQNIYAAEDSGVSLPTIIAFVLLLFGSKLLADTTKANPSQFSVSSSSRGTLLGYSPDGLPLYHLQSQLKTANVIQTLKSFLKSILESTDSRQIFYFLCLNFAFMLTEFTYG